MFTCLLTGNQVLYTHNFDTFYSKHNFLKNLLYLSDLKFVRLVKFYLLERKTIRFFFFSFFLSLWFFAALMHSGLHWRSRLLAGARFLSLNGKCYTAQLWLASLSLSFCLLQQAMNFAWIQSNNHHGKIDKKTSTVDGPIQTIWQVTESFFSQFHLS